MADTGLCREISPKSPRRTRGAAGTCGPVSDLEMHLPSEWWRSVFNSLYLKTDGDVIGNDEITSYEVERVLEILTPPPGARILDLCCGTGRHSLELSRRGYDVEGLDQSSYLVAQGRMAALENGLSVRFRRGNAGKLPRKPGQYDAVVILGNSFGYFDTAEEDLTVLREIRRVLKPCGRVLIDIPDGAYLRDHFSPRSWEWIDERLFVCRERQISEDKERLVSREVICDVRKGVIADRFYAERFYTASSIRKVLASAGFEEIAFHDMESRSDRNQDLGMMERRFLVSAAVCRDRPVKNAALRNSLTHVAVFLGDPQKPDELKPSSLFDEDDFYTIDVMKKALEQLSGYRFTYYQNHDSMITDMLMLRGRIDYIFNLCDEGFGNDPRKELHIPALAEMTGIPCTGAGPQALSTCFDKSLVRGIASQMGIPIPRGVIIPPGGHIPPLPSGFPVIVKPNSGDSSFGITEKSVARSSRDLVSAVSRIRKSLSDDVTLIVEEFLPGREVSVGIIGNSREGFCVLPVSEEDYSALPAGLPAICGYEAKWLFDSPYQNIRSVPADITEQTEKELSSWCIQLFERLGCRDYCRFDWRMDSAGVPRLLEVNPNPGWCWDGHLAKMAGFAGFSYPEMLKMILSSAEQRMDLSPLPSLSAAAEAGAAVRTGVSEAYDPCE